MDLLPLEAKKSDNFRKATGEGCLHYYFKMGFQRNLVSYLHELVVIHQNVSCIILCLTHITCIKVISISDIITI